VERPAAAFIKSQITVRRAALAIAICTVVITLAGGIAIWALDHQEFPSIGAGLWWSVQTITTVGYGDDVPARTEGRIIAALIMIAGIGLLSVVTATVTAAFVEGARSRLGRGRDSEIIERLERIEQRLQQMEGGRDAVER
jgi:voltage-gated potassium channel Kch